MKLLTLDELLIDCLRDMLSAENQAVKALPKLARAASHPALKAAFAEHLEQTRGQVERLERAGEALGKKLRAKTCAAMQGLIEEAQELIDAEGDPAVKDAALIGAAQKQEHYEIAAYGTARSLAEQSGADEVAQLLQQTLDEEKETDRKLTELALAVANVEAAEAGEEDGESAAKPARKRAPAKRAK